MSECAFKINGESCSKEACVKIKMKDGSFSWFCEDHATQIITEKTLDQEEIDVNIIVN